MAYRNGKDYELTKNRIQNFLGNKFLITRTFSDKNEGGGDAEEEGWKTAFETYVLSVMAHSKREKDNLHKVILIYDKIILFTIVELKI